MPTDHERTKRNARVQTSTYLMLAIALLILLAMTYIGMLQADRSRDIYRSTALSDDCRLARLQDSMYPGHYTDIPGLRLRESCGILESPKPETIK